MDNKEQKKNLRSPVVVIMGHVDHGKSSILEAIRDLKILAKESGGITQHIGAYEIIEKDKKITFIDTPGHEIFSQMRSRGARVADIAVLVVAAEEGVKPQTKEAILHIKEAKIPFIVAINKIDKAVADPQRVKGGLAKEGVLVESMGGEIPSVNVSAHTKEGIEDLLDLILLLSEIEKLEFDSMAQPQGVVIEAYMDSQKGPTATVVLMDGVLETGTIIATSSATGKIKNLQDFKGITINKVYPSTPAIVFGFENVPKVGEEFRVFKNTEEAKSFFKEVPKKEKTENKIINKDKKVLNFILKADVSGSLEAIEDVLAGILTEEAFLNILKTEVGEVNVTDVKLAKGTNSKILAYRVKTNLVAKSLAEREKVRIMKFEVVYELIENVRKLIERISEPEITRNEVGKIKILAVFITEKNRQILGGKVIEGEGRKRVSCDILRKEEKIGHGKIINIQRNKKDVEKIPKGDECGMIMESETRAQEGDVLALFEKIN